MAAPPADFPTIYADNVASSSNNSHVVKFYLGRVDSDTTGIGGSIRNEIQQIIMPIGGFVQSVAFLVRAIDGMAKDGLVEEGAFERRLAELREKEAALPPPT